HFKGCLATQLHDHALRLLQFNNFAYVLPKDGLKVQLISHVEVRRDGFGVTVDHDSLVSSLFGREQAMHAGIVKLNTLANTVRSGTQYDNLLAIGWFRFILILESGVVVRRLRGEFRRTSVDHFEYPADTELHTAIIHVILAHVAKHPRDLQVRITFLLQGHKEFSGNIVKLIATKLCLQLYQFLYLHQEPLVDQGRLADRLQRHAQFKRVFHMEQAVAARMLQTFHNLFQVPALPSVRTETRPPDLQALAGFLQGLDKG